MGAIPAFALIAALSACSSGSQSDGFRDPALAQSYIGLANPAGGVAGGGAVVIAPNIAVTNRHNANLLAEEDILAVSDRIDLLFFRTAETQPARTVMAPRLGQAVIAYGQGNSDELREASGVIEFIAPSREDCRGCPEGTGFVYRAAAGPGFSGGPVTDGQTGAVLGITFAYIDSSLDEGKPRLMLAYDLAQIAAEQRRLMAQENQ